MWLRFLSKVFREWIVTMNRMYDAFVWLTLVNHYRDYRKEGLGTAEGHPAPDGRVACVGRHRLGPLGLPLDTQHLYQQTARLLPRLHIRLFCHDQHKELLLAYNWCRFLNFFFLIMNKHSLVSRPIVENSRSSVATGELLSVLWSHTISRLYQAGFSLDLSGLLRNIIFLLPQIYIWL